MGFTKLGLSEELIQAVYGAGYALPTDIQQHAIPAVLKGRDILACAPTGTGKTAAFVLPMLQILGRTAAPARVGRYPRALVLTPTRELALQIEEAIRTYGCNSPLQPIVVYGGVGMYSQVQGLKMGADIMVATPGRLLDLLQRNSTSLSAIEYLVLDEADRMFDMGFIHDVQNIVGRTPRQRQTLLFSATMSPEIRKLVESVQTNPIQITIGQSNSPVDSVEQAFYAVSQQVKMDLLVHILSSEPINTMLVFSRTKHGADKIARKLDNHGIRTAAIHADRSQSQREAALLGFKQGHFQVLVATDIAARGIDVDGISHVVNFDTPMAPEDYIHRIGRTGRADATGTAFTFVSDDEVKYLRRIEELIGKNCELDRYPGFHASGREEFSGQGHAPRPAYSRRKRSFGRKSPGQFEAA